MYPTLKKLIKTAKVQLYKPLSIYLKKHFKCFESGVKKGSSPVGEVDIIGIRDVGGHLSGDVEVIVVEVKNKLKNLGKYIGQALGYSICAHRCYLAVFFKKREGFTEEHKQVANHHGVGLIEIKKRKNKFICTEILTSRLFTPKEYFLLNYLEKLKVYKCAICNNYFKEKQKIFKVNKKPSIYNYKVPIDRPLLFRTKTYKKIILCTTCRYTFDMDSMEEMSIAKIVDIISRRLIKKKQFTKGQEKRIMKELKEYY